ncbi:glucose-fructose oxidoreductase [Sphingomonas naasensis]|uniref:Gfo/Idh/MocA family oxidoreductase n=1 Tax=Sphingomonas naasensis TaxID=1344951 RepID=A0A4S1WAZ6_9SPHN|nr:Gfo/Idh/MocA family oxidoreductase [Sphingomonas naasensis]NIJ19830.1 glucose-fructose oxidoreductase [Sphingomonas naasensis]TGX40038.1 Gfo/Idh/MocA family oxidoreductase [Sphingomonas naasensis]
MGNRQSRREVLTGSGVALLAATLPACGWAQEPPKRKLGYAIVGLGSYATRQIMPRLKDCEFAKLAALVSGTPEKLERYGAEYGIPKTHRYSYANYDSIRDNPDIDLVYVVLPNSMHAEYSIRASQAGKHVLCEKPMAVSAAECEVMIAAAKKAGKKLMIGYRCHFEPYNLRGIELVKSGFVGRPRVITSEHGFNAQPNQWRLDRPLSGGGSMMDIGIYSLNAARYLAGEEPIEVSAMESTDRKDPRFRNVEDQIDWQMRFPSGALASCVSSYSSNHNAWRVVGTDGWVGMEPATGYDGHQMWTRKGGKTEQVTLPAPPKNQFVAQLDHLAECAMNGREPIVSGEEGLRDMRLIEAIYRSAREGKAVRMTAA